MVEKPELLLSFVVPCYNVEKYIQRCLDSIFACDLPREQYEVICVNDCSPDIVQDVLESNEKTHNNLRIAVHERNRGLGGARNTGIREALGKYIWFVDSDDTVIGNGLTMVLNRAAEECLDVMCFNYRRVDNQGVELSRHLVFGDRCAENGCLFAKEAFEPGGIVNHMGFVWRFLYRADFLRSRHLFFPENVCWEDTVFMPRAILEADRVASTTEVLYSYWVNEDSISGTFSRLYPAKLIFEFAFVAGGDLLCYSRQVNDSDMEAAFRNTAIEKYINGFPIHLFRTSRKERKTFYGMIVKNKKGLALLKSQMRPFNRLLLASIIGPILANSIAILYKLTHKRNW